MNQTKGIIALIAILGLAFGWGVYGDVILEESQTLLQSELKAPVEAAAVGSPPSETTQPGAQGLSPSIPAEPRSNTALNQDATQSYDQMMRDSYKQAPPNTLPGTTPGTKLNSALDAIKPGQIQDTAIVQRNAYFEKLSQQLKELKGETPPQSPPTTQAGIEATPVGLDPTTITPPAPPPAFQPEPVVAPPIDQMEDLPEPEEAEFIEDQEPGVEELPPEEQYIDEQEYIDEEFEE